MKKQEHLPMYGVGPVYAAVILCVIVYLNGGTALNGLGGEAGGFDFLIKKGEGKWLKTNAFL